MELTIRVSLKSEPDCCPRSNLRGCLLLAGNMRRRDGDALALRGAGHLRPASQKEKLLRRANPAPAGPERERVQDPLPRGRCRRAAAQRPSDPRRRRTHSAKQTTPREAHEKPHPPPGIDGSHPKFQCAQGHRTGLWIPACAGMTGTCGVLLCSMHIHGHWPLDPSSGTPQDDGCMGAVVVPHAYTLGSGDSRSA